MAVNMIPKVAIALAAGATIDKDAYDAGVAFAKVYRIMPAPLDNKTEPLGSGHSIFTGRKAMCTIECLAGSNSAIDAIANGENLRDVMIAGEFVEGEDAVVYRNCNIKKDYTPVYSADDNSISYEVYILEAVSGADELPIDEIEIPKIT